MSINWLILGCVLLVVLVLVFYLIIKNSRDENVLEKYFEIEDKSTEQKEEELDKDQY